MAFRAAMLTTLRQGSALLVRTTPSAVRTAAPAGTIHTTQTLRKRKSDELKDKVALITGSRGGIGEGIAQELASKGCEIIMTGVSRNDEIPRIKEQFWEDYNIQPLHIYADLSQKSEIENLCDEIYKVHPGGVDILINNAGFQHVCPLLEFPDERWEKMIAVMLSAPFYLSKILGESMKKKRWGRIINVSSAHGVIASPKKAAYVSAKHGLVGLSKVTALEMAQYGVTCNALCPGYVNTPILQGQVRTLQEELKCSYEEAEEEFLGKYHATNKCIEIPHLAQMVAFLCSEASAQITGASLVIDGGWSAK